MKNYPTNKRVLTMCRLLFFLPLLFCGFASQGQGCTLACNSQVKVVLGPGQTDIYKPQDLLEGTLNCTNPIFSFSDMPEDTLLELHFTDLGPRTYQITELTSGNKCWGNLSIISLDCVGDTIPPVFDFLPSDTTIGCGDPLPIFFTLTGTDNCDDNLSFETFESVWSFGCPGELLTTRTWTVTDDNFNTATHTQNVMVAGGSYTLNIPADYQGECGVDFAPEALTAEHDLNCDLLAVSREDIVIINDTACTKIIRTYTIIDWCYTDMDSTIQLPNHTDATNGLFNGYTVEIDAVSRNMTTSDGPLITDSAPQVITYRQIIKYPSCSEPEAVCQAVSSTILAGQTQDVWAIDFNDNSFDDCSFDSLNFRVVWADSSDQMTPPTSELLTYDDSFAGIHQVELWVSDADGNWDFCTTDFEVIIGLQTGDFFTGYVFSDANGDCLWDRTSEEGLENWTVSIIGFPSGNDLATTIATDRNGQFSVSLPDFQDTLYRVSLISNINYGQQCPTVYEFKGEPGNQTFEIEIPVVLEGDCPLLAIDISAARLRRCFPSRYQVNYCNYGAVTATDASVEVELDPFLTFLDAQLTPSDIQGNIYTFDLGDVDPGDCGRFFINVEVSCDAVLGQTHCSAAHIFPDTICSDTIIAQWAGATIEAEVVCDGDSVQLKLKNVGSGDMIAPLDFIIIEDVVMYRQGTFNLQAGEEIPFPMTASGSTWNIQAEQEPNHPYAVAPSLSIEGCISGTSDIFSTGFVSQFAQQTGNGFTDVDCQENIGSYDPNDKAASPVGYGSRFQIDQNVDLEYKIRFQNTGTDTAFTVRIEDKLSEHLDIETIIPGASSHDYSFCVHDDGTMIFLFENILLPDSSTNQIGSNGFVNFKVAQKPDVALETIIPNTANIFFDFNDPVITNEVLHTVGLDIMTVSVIDMPESLGFEVYPNPFKNQATFKLNENITGEWILEIYDLTGKKIRAEKASGNNFIFNRKDMTEGVYFFKLKTEDGRAGNGKIVISN